MTAPLGLFKSNRNSLFNPAPTSHHHHRPPPSCAVRALDPRGKFAGAAPDRWTWAGVDLARCCTRDGFDATKAGCACRVAHARPKEDCPPAPFYTTY